LYRTKKSLLKTQIFDATPRPTAIYNKLLRQ
jgi:hypothetical protein